MPIVSWRESTLVYNHRFVSCWLILGRTIEYRIIIKQTDQPWFLFIFLFIHFISRDFNLAYLIERVKFVSLHFCHVCLNYLYFSFESARKFNFSRKVVNPSHNFASSLLHPCFFLKFSKDLRLCWQVYSKWYSWIIFISIFNTKSRLLSLYHLLFKTLFAFLTACLSY